jgi:hypothetical protein
MWAFYAALLGAFLFVVAMASGPDVGDLNPRQPHHEYWGFLILSLAAIPHLHWLKWVGGYLMLDDGVQHALQRMFDKPTLKLSLFDYFILRPLWKYQVVQDAAAFFTRLMA